MNEALLIFWIAYPAIGIAFVAGLAVEHRQERGYWPSGTPIWAFPLMILLWPVGLYGLASGKLK